MSLFENIFEKIIKVAMLRSHPVGSYYWSSESTDPSEIFGGKWTQIKDRFVYAAGSIEAENQGGVGQLH